MKPRPMMRISAALLASLIGLQAMVAASGVLMGLVNPDYVVLRWLVFYNAAMGGLALVAGVLIWRDHAVSRRAAALVLAAHSLVLALLGIMRAVGEPVATQSLEAMAFRVVMWLAIVTLVVVARRSPLGSPPPVEGATTKSRASK